MGDMKSQLATAYSQVRLPVSGLVAFNWAVGHGSHGNPQTMQAVAKTPVTLYNLKSGGLVLPRTIHTTHWTWRSLAGAYTEPSPLRSSVWCGKVLCRLPKKKHRHQHSHKTFDRQTVPFIILSQDKITFRRLPKTQDPPALVSQVLKKQASPTMLRLQKTKDLITLEQMIDKSLLFHTSIAII